MVMYEIELEPGGKVTLPKEFIERLNLQEGEKMTVELLYRRPKKLDIWPYLFIYPHKQRLIDIL